MANICFWFRQDLRLKDNYALQLASRNNDGDLIALYVITNETWLEHCWSDAKVDFILRQLKQLSAELTKLNIPLKIIQAKSFANIPKALKKFCNQHNINAVYVNKQLLVDECQRDNKVSELLESNGIAFKQFDDATILHPNETLKKDGTPFKVFTPFSRHWLKTVTPDRYFSDSKKPCKQKKLSAKPDVVPDNVKGFKATPELYKSWPVGEAQAHKRLAKFCEHKATQYDRQRDFPALEATSLISAYLASGLLSVRQCITQLCDAASAHNINQIFSDKGSACWLNELIWREFYYAVAYLFPEVVRNKPFKRNTNALKWSQSKKNFQAWCEGKTGFPLVDAGMRQLNQTGWMHNRVRMVTAMFLTKTLFINWRWGEDYFMRQLIDGDFASNNGGWQWSASTGTDAVPYFRIFNPTTQSERFDPEGVYIRQYCPELADCTNKQIHNPPLDLRKELLYPNPIVDYKVMRAKVLAAFKELPK